MIRRLQPGYKGGIGVIYSKEADKEKIRYCSRCEDLFQVKARLGPRIRTDGNKKEPGDENFLSCRNCGSIFGKYETKVEPVLEPIVEPQKNPFRSNGRTKAITRKPKGKGRGNNPRIKKRDDIKDEELKSDLRRGGQLVSYSSSD